MIWVDVKGYFTLSLSLMVLRLSNSELNAILVAAIVGFESISPSDMNAEWKTSAAKLKVFQKSSPKITL